MLTFIPAPSLFVQVTIQSANKIAVRVCDIHRTKFLIKHADMLVLTVANSEESVFILCFFTTDKHRIL
jgi:predicted membrane-bound mannosyltransferase